MYTFKGLKTLHLALLVIAATGRQPAAARGTRRLGLQPGSSHSAAQFTQCSLTPATLKLKDVGTHTNTHFQPRNDTNVLRTNFHTNSDRCVAKMFESQSPKDTLLPVKTYTMISGTDTIIECSSLCLLPYFRQKD